MDVSDNIASCSVPGDLSYGLQEDFQFNENLYKSVVERYYTKRYKIGRLILLDLNRYEADTVCCLDLNKSKLLFLDHRNGEDICILEHSNR